jgi:hypothetical protein
MSNTSDSAASDRFAGLPPELCAGAVYENFGLHGFMFDGLLRDTWEFIATEWPNRACRLPGQPSLVDAVRFCDRSQFWIDIFMLFWKVDPKLSDAEFVRLWESFRSKLQPALRPVPLLLQPLAIAVRFLLAKVRMEAETSPPMRINRAVLNNISHGAFTEAEINTILKHYPRLLEYGAGSGYLMDVLIQRGCDVVGIDNNAYRISDQQVHPWTARLLQERRLIIGDTNTIEQHCADRALLISWPEPGSAYPAEVLERYGRAGGKSLIFKFGGFGGTRVSSDPSYRPSSTPGANVLRFLKLIIRDWKEVPERSYYQPLASENSLWVFERVLK